jgi:hypothetical protein
VTVPRLQKQFDVTFPTAQADVEKLVLMGILNKSPRNNETQYYITTEIFDAAYRDNP